MEFLLDARYIAVCNNEACDHYAKVRKATLPYVGPGLVLEPRIVCACGHPTFVSPEAAEEMWPKPLPPPYRRIDFSTQPESSEHAMTWDGPFGTPAVYIVGCKCGWSKNTFAATPESSIDRTWESHLPERTDADG